MSKKLLLAMKDGGIVRIETDKESFGGCETCDYGSSYVNKFDIYVTAGKIAIEVDNMYEYALSEGHMMELILPNVDAIREMTEWEFFSWISGHIQHEDWRVQIHFYELAQYPSIAEDEEDAP